MKNDWYVRIHSSIYGKVLRKLYKYTSDRKYIESAGAKNLGYRLNLDDPKTFNEKMAWLKLYYHNPILHRLVDKYKVKEIVSQKLGEEYVANVIGIYDRIEDAIENLPNPPFVVKSTHYGAPIVIGPNGDVDKNKIEAILRKQKTGSGYTSHREWGYKDVPQRIMIEEFMADESDNKGLQDYKFWCFNGVPKAMYLTIKEGEIYENFYDMDFNPISINHGFPRKQPEFSKPENFEEMKRIAAILSKGLPFVRIDLYNISGKIKFGEYTFFDWGGAHPFITYDQDLKIGEWLVLPNEKLI